MRDAERIAKLRRDGVLRVEGGRLRTARRWHAAMMRAALRLMIAGDDASDLRVPIAWALWELYGATADDDELVALVEIMTEVERRELPIRDAV